LYELNTAILLIFEMQPATVLGKKTLRDTLEHGWE